MSEYLEQSFELKKTWIILLQNVEIEDPDLFKQLSDIEMIPLLISEPFLLLSAKDDKLGAGICDELINLLEEYGETWFNKHFSPLYIPIDPLKELSENLPLYQLKSEFPSPTTSLGISNDNFYGNFFIGTTHYNLITQIEYYLLGRLNAPLLYIYEQSDNKRQKLLESIITRHKDRISILNLSVDDFIRQYPTLIKSNTPNFLQKSFETTEFLIAHDIEDLKGELAIATEMSYFINKLIISKQIPIILFGKVSPEKLADVLPDYRLASLIRWGLCIELK